jgi:eukaryotic-like serine/threonine-protein kinase
LLGLLAQGGRSEVYLAAAPGPEGLGRPVVVKRMRDAGDPRQRVMFLHEARLARLLAHPNLVRTHEVGVDGGHLVIVMEYLHGPTLLRLRQAAASVGGIPCAVELEILSQVLEGLHHAHELLGPDGWPLQLVHRNVCPENVIVTRGGDCKLLDFGIAKTADSFAQTAAGERKGRIENMAPEQLRGEPVDRAADIYAAGAMLWEGLSRKRLWGKQGHSAIARRLTRGDIPSLKALDPVFPLELRAVCARALHPEPARRHLSAGELRAEIQAYMRRHRLLVSRSDLGAFVEHWFGDGRERIEQVADALDPRGPVHPAPAELSQIATLIMPRPRHTTQVSQAFSVAGPDPRRLGRRPLLLAAGMLLLGFSLVTLADRIRTEPPPRAATAPVVRAPVPPPPPAPSLPTPAAEPARPSDRRGPRTSAKLLDLPAPSALKPDPPPRSRRLKHRRRIDVHNPYRPRAR